MKRLMILCFAAGICAAPVLAQDEEDDVSEGFDLMEEGAKLLMRGLMSEVAPAIDDLRSTLEEMGPELGTFITTMGPALSELLAEVDDFSHYAPPEFMPNGDIIMRRKPTAPLWMPEGETGEIEL
ncbi:AAA+ family ATPase [Yoonia sp. BS5-3]|uniref:AAA+ family ATPase n=1 Tax=Yoonia phaeophyticola TaxID=3137369 RepID=A0ABZ2V968_9RHOB